MEKRSETPHRLSDIQGLLVEYGNQLCAFLNTVESSFKATIYKIVRAVYADLCNRIKLFGDVDKCAVEIETKALRRKNFLKEIKD